MILMPGHVPLRHMSTPAKVTDMLRRLCALDVPDSLLKVGIVQFCRQVLIYCPVSSAKIAQFVVP